jgi:hypothetical protein
MKRKALRKLWVSRVSAFERSGLTRSAWCAARNVSVGSLDAWRYRLQRERAEAEGRAGGRTSRPRSTALVMIVIGAPSPEATTTATEAATELSRPHGVRLRASSLPSAQWLAHLVRELVTC